MRERIRAVIGLWTPMVLGLVLIGLAVNFLISPPSVRDPLFRLEPFAAVACGGGVILVGGLLILSTYGRWRKLQASRRAGP